jgi:hypothetical protein
MLHAYDVNGKEYFSRCFSFLTSFMPFCFDENLSWLWFSDWSTGSSRNGHADVHGQGSGIRAIR